MIKVAADPSSDKHSRQIELETLNFVYVNTRTYLPTVLSARRALANFSGTDNLANAVDLFLSGIVLSANDRERSTYCRPPLSWILENRLMGDSVETNVAVWMLDLPLRNASVALERIAEEIAKLSCT